MKADEDEESLSVEDARGDAEVPGYMEVRGLMVSDALPRIARVLAKEYPDAKADAEDAVYNAVVKYLAKRASGAEIQRPDNYIFIAAKNFMRRKFERQFKREASAGDRLDGEFEAADAGVLARDTYEYCKGLVQRWESNRMREVTLLFLEAIYEDELLTQEEAADQVSLILDEDVPWTSIGKTRARGFGRLREEILSIASQTGINPLDGSETK